METSSTSGAAGAESIVVENLHKRYGDFEALDGISFSIKPGEIVGFLGPNGAGKTTTMKILTCFMSATGGSARVAGFDVQKDSAEVRRRVGYLPENVPLYDEMIVFDYLRFVAELRGVAKARRQERIRAVAELTGLEQVMGRTISELSKGYRQRVGLAQAIIHEPDVIVLDEPTTGLDPNQIIEIRDVIKTIGKEKTIIFSTHILQEVTAVCDRIIIINRGKIVADGSLHELEARVAKAEPGLVVSYEGEASDALNAGLSNLAGVEGVSEVGGRPGSCTYRLKTLDKAATRRALLAGEPGVARELLSLREAEPTLEAIFRLYTGGETEEGARVEVSVADTSAMSSGGEEVVAQQGDAPVEASSENLNASPPEGAESMVDEAAAMDETSESEEVSRG
ncbi:ATP-binding cassette domain-containing protein [Bradymonadaceae bacterium TMQ3]|nr:ATP-binding cassette domain-containing protein [Bradymonadaceae bacterium TMQ3]TXC75558.1 ATP-binding cassette domain-containing protein [Bradymonadales bacterium TMQ1]